MYALGVTIAQANAEIQSAIKGTTATLYHDKGSDIDVIVSLDPKDKTSIADLDNLYVTSSAGLRVPLSNFATYTQGTGPISIAHEDQSRVVHVTANIRPGHTVDKTQREIQALIDANIPQDSDVMITYSGDYQELQQGLTTFAEIIIMAILLVFAIMASQFESFKNPFIILFCIPLSVIGIVLIYLATGQTLSLITAVGLLLLVGIIVNNGIVLVDSINQRVRKHEPVRQACLESARTRLRPILMTTLTTVVGMIPLAFFPGSGSEMMQPIALTFVGGSLSGIALVIIQQEQETKAMQTKGILFAVFGAIVQSLSLVLTKFALASTGAVTTNTIRALGGLLSLFLFSLIRKNVPRDFSSYRRSGTRLFLLLVLGSLLGPIIGMSSEMQAFRLAPLGTATAIAQSSPVILLIQEAVTRAKRVTLEDALFTLWAVGGIALLFIAN